ncbi:MAG: hypothetical protein ABS939_04300 [Psychrobacillus sp.]
MQAIYNQIDPLKYIKILHRDTDGYITFMRKFKYTDKVKQQHVYLNEITPELINSYVCKDSYLSLNSFYRPLRRNNQLRTIHNFYVDLDCYSKGLIPEQVILHLNKDYFKSKLPVPNVILYSGRGLALIWQAEAISGLAIEKWRKVQREIFNLLQDFGADSKCTTDAARVFRLPASINSKSNEVVRYDHLHNSLIDIKTFSTYFLTGNENEKPQQHKANSENNANGEETKSKQPKKKLPKRFTVNSLLMGRLKDLETLIKIRKGKMEGYRERLLFVARHYTYLLTENKEKAIQKILELNGLFDVPLSEGEVVNSTASAIRYADSNDNLRLYNATLTEWFDITEAEMQHLSILISKSEKQRRNRKTKEKARRMAGAKTKAEYNRRRTARVKRLLAKLKLIRATYPKLTYTAIAKLMSVSKSYITKLVKMLAEGIYVEPTASPVKVNTITAIMNAVTNPLKLASKNAIESFVTSEQLLEYQNFDTSTQ